MTQYLITIKNGDYPLTFRAKTITEAFMCLVTAEQNHHLDNLPSFLNRDRLMEDLVRMKNNQLTKTETAAYAIERWTDPATYIPDPPPPVPDWLEEAQEHWRRFELTVTSKEQVDELNAVLKDSNFTRRDLALIVTCLRLRPEFTLADFTAKEDSGEPFATEDP